MAGYPIPNLSLGAGCLSCQAGVSQHADLLGIVLKMPSYIKVSSARLWREHI